MHTDINGDIRRRADETLVKNMQKVESMRADRMARDESRWANHEAKESAEFARWDQLRADENNTAARRGKTRYRTVGVSCVCMCVLGPLFGPCFVCWF